mgnify:CR=1 FL=1
MQSPVCDSARLATKKQCGRSDGSKKAKKRAVAPWEKFCTNDNSGEPESCSKASSSPVWCIQDCPRTNNSYDSGNPQDANDLDQQQEDRTVTFMFRQRSNFSLIFRNEAGAEALTNTDNDLFDEDGNGPDYTKLERNGDGNVKGRNLLISGIDFVALPDWPAPPAPPQGSADASGCRCEKSDNAWAAIAGDGLHWAGTVSTGNGSDFWAAVDAGTAGAVECQPYQLHLELSLSCQAGHRTTSPWCSATHWFCRL